MRLGISNYGALVTRGFDMVGYINALATEAKADFTRVFNDLTIWDLVAGEYKFDPLKAVFIYPFDKVTKKWKLGTINQEYVDRLGAIGMECRKHKNPAGEPFQVVICGAVDPKYYANSPVKGMFNQMGYADSKQLFHQGDFFADRWALCKQYWRDLATVLASLKMGLIFKTHEAYNEMPEWGSIVDELKGLRGEFGKAKYNPALQLNPPSPYEEEVPADWATKLLAGVSGVKVSRFAFHGYFTGAEVKEDLDKLKAAGVPSKVVTIETDGSSPGFGLSRKTQQGHYKLRPTWQAHKPAVFKAHRQIIDAAFAAGAACNLQDVAGWSDEMNWNYPAAKAFRIEMGKSVK